MKLERNEKGFVLVDALWETPSINNGYIAQINGKPYLYTGSIDSLRPVSELWFEKLANKSEAYPFAYIMANFYKIGGFKVDVGRAISCKEFEELKRRFNVTEEEITSPYEETKGVCNEDCVRYKAVQVKINNYNPISLERELRKKGIEAFSANVSRITLRVE